MYRVTTYYSIKGLIKFVDLGDFTYGEWIVYDNKIPKYHINSFNKGSNSDILINSLLESKKETIESIINKINIEQGTKLSLGNRPLIELIKKSEMMNLDLTPLPEHWIKTID